MKFPIIGFDILCHLLNAPKDFETGIMMWWTIITAIIVLVVILYDINELIDTNDNDKKEERTLFIKVFAVIFVFLATTGLGGSIVASYIFFASYLLKLIFAKTVKGIIYLFTKKSIDPEDYTIANIICWIMATALILYLFYILFQQTILSLIPVLPLEKP